MSQEESVAPERHGEIWQFCEALNRPAKLEKMRKGYRCECGELVTNVDADERDLNRRTSQR